MPRPDSVLMNEFLDEHGLLRVLAQMTFDELVQYHGIRNRAQWGRGMYCRDCCRPAHLLQFRSTNRFAVRHNPGEGGDRCQFEDAYKSFRNAVSEEHAKAAARIVVATRDHEGWSAEPEHTVPHSGIRADVYAWHRTGTHDYQKPVVWEVQMSPQTYQDTVARTIQRNETYDGAKVRWVTPDSNIVSRPLTDPDPDYPIVGIITDREGVNVVDRAYVDLGETPAELTLEKAVKGLIRPTNRLVLIDWEDAKTGDGIHILIPEAAGSTISPTPRRARPDRPDVVDPTPCGRNRVELPPWIRPAGPILEQQLFFTKSVADAVVTEPLHDFGPRSACPHCSADVPAYTLDIHISLAHPRREAPR